MKIPILVKVWAGAQRHDLRYIGRSLPSLLASDLPDDVQVIFVDDCSPNERIQPLLTDLARQDRRVEIWTHPHRMGPNRGQEYNFARLVERYPDAPYYVTCDDDVVYHPGWLQRVLQVHQEARAAGIDGILTAMNAPARPSYASLSLPTSEVILKERQMALNWIIPREVYERVGPFRDVGIAYDSEYCDRMAALGIPVICLKPSWVQNIGYHGAYQSDETLTAADYVGNRDAYLIARDAWYRVRRLAIRTAERVPNGRLKAAVKLAARPLRQLMQI